MSFQQQRNKMRVAVTLDPFVHCLKGEDWSVFWRRDLFEEHLFTILCMRLTLNSPYPTGLFDNHLCLSTLPPPHHSTSCPSLRFQKQTNKQPNTNTNTTQTQTKHKHHKQNTAAALLPTPPHEWNKMIRTASICLNEYRVIQVQDSLRVGFGEVSLA